MVYRDNRIIERGMLYAEKRRQGLQGRSSEKYSLWHKERQECLARAMVGAFKVLQAEHAGIHDSFSVKKAREYAEKLMKNEMFKKLCADRVAVDQLCHDAAANPQNLHKVTAQILWPFCIAETTPGAKRERALEERREILTRLQKMAMLMDGTRGRSSQWKAFQKNIREGLSGGELWDAG